MEDIPAYGYTIPGKDIVYMGTEPCAGKETVLSFSTMDEKEGVYRVDLTNRTVEVGETGDVYSLGSIELRKGEGAVISLQDGSMLMTGPVEDVVFSEDDRTLDGRLEQNEPELDEREY
jgi:hypothetical protein